MESKEELLSELYAIRAAMSLVSQNDDAAEPTRKEIMDRKNSIKNIELALPYENRQYDENRKRSERHCFDISQNIEKCNQTIEAQQAQIEDYRQKAEYWRNRKPTIRNNKANVYMPDGFWPAFVFIAVVSGFMIIWGIGLVCSNEGPVVGVYMSGQSWDDCRSCCKRNVYSRKTTVERTLKDEVRQRKHVNCRPADTDCP